MATELEHTVGKNISLNGMRLLIARAEMCCGDVPSFSRRAAADMQEADEHNDRFLSISVRGTYGALALLASGQVDAAQRELEKAEALLPREGCGNLRLYCQIGQVCMGLYRGDACAAHAQWDELWPILSKDMLLRVQALSVVAYELRARSALGCLAASPNGSNSRLTKMAREGIVALSKTQAPYALALAELLSAGLKSCSNDRDAALSDLRSAVSQLEALDMRLHAAAARRACGLLSGGSAGSEEVSRAEAFMRDLGIADPAFFARVLVPGMPQDLGPLPP
jgi:hypothetical protein